MDALRRYEVEYQTQALAFCRDHQVDAFINVEVEYPLFGRSIVANRWQHVAYQMGTLRAMT